jgi:hypothetical protein
MATAAPVPARRPNTPTEWAVQLFEPEASAFNRVLLAGVGFAADVSRAALIRRVKSSTLKGT